MGQDSEEQIENVMWTAVGHDIFDHAISNKKHNWCQLLLRTRIDKLFSCVFS